MLDVLCFGNLQFDVLCRPVTALPAPGALQMIEHIDMSLSGNGGTLAAVLGRLGLRVDLAGYAGADLVGAQFVRILNELGVGTGKLSMHPSAPSGTSVITIAPDGERSILYVNGANALFDLDSVPDSWLAEPRVVALGSIFILPQFSGAAIGRLFERARRWGALTVLNMAWDDRHLGIDVVVPALRETDYLVLSLEEGRQLTGRRSPDEILQAIEPHLRGVAVLTLGKDGCCFRDEEHLHRAPAIPVVATDTTGAGDAFMAGLIAGLVQGRSLRECATLGTCVASYAVTGPGAYPRVPPLAELERHFAHVLAR